MIFINPSNPCGTVFGRDHQERLVDLCDRYKLPIIADEIYAGMIFPGCGFSSFAEVSKRVPTIVCGGLAKRFLVPGWRMGWTIVHDPTNVYRGALSKAINKLTTRLVGPNTVIQAAIPHILEQTPESWHKEQNKKLANGTVFRVKRNRDSEFSRSAVLRWTEGCTWIESHHAIRCHVYDGKC